MNDHERRLRRLEDAVSGVVGCDRCQEIESKVWFRGWPGEPEPPTSCDACGRVFDVKVIRYPESV